MNHRYMYTPPPPPKKKKKKEKRKKRNITEKCFGHVFLKEWGLA